MNIRPINLSAIPKPLFAIAVIALLAILLCHATVASAYISLPREPVPNKVAVADCVVVGRVTATQPEPVTARPYRQQELQMEFMVAEVEVTETLLGPKAAHVRMGFIRFKLRSGEYKSVPAIGQVGCFFAAKSDKDLYVVPTGCFLPKGDADYDQDLALARRCARALNEPDRQLKSKEPADRLLAACMLILRYEYAPMRWGGKLKGEPIDAEQSKLILLALADADWTTPDPLTKLSPGSVISWLVGSTGRTGLPWPKTWPPQRGNGADVAAAQKQWLRDNAETYRIRRLVLANPDKPPASQPASDLSPGDT